MTLKEAAKIVEKSRGNDSILYAFKYRQLYVFRLLTKGAQIGSTLDYYVSVNIETSECKVFDAYDELCDNPNEFSLAAKNKIDPRDF